MLPASRSLPALPDRPPFTIRARVLTPLDGGGFGHFADGLVSVDANGRITTVGDTASGRPGAAAGLGAAPGLGAAAGLGAPGLGAAPAPGVVDLRPWVVLPGMVDLHAHLPQLPNSGLGFALDLLTWLDRITFPTERAWADPELVDRLAPAIFRAFAAAGTTTLVGYGAVYEAAMDASFRAADAHGIRAILGKVMMDRVTYDESIPPTTILERSLRESAGLIERWHGHDDGRLGYAVTPRFAVSCTADLLRESAALARSSGAWWQTHVSEDPGEIAEVRRLFPEATDYVDVYDRAGGLGARTILAHAIHLSPREITRLSDTGTRIAHCPASNLFIGAGLMPLSAYLRAGIAIGLGSDVSGGAEASIFSVMQMGAYSQMARRAMERGGQPAAGAGGARVAGAGSAGQPAAGAGSADPPPAPPLGPLDWLRLGTLDGARALGLDDRIGSIEAGKEADLIVVDPAMTAPLADVDPVALDDPEDLVSRLIFRAHPGMVRGAWVRGRRLEGPA